MKRFLVILQLVIFASYSVGAPAYAQQNGLLSKKPIGQDSEGAPVGPFKVTDVFCKNFTKMAAILNAFQIVQWPVAGFPGVVIGQTQRSSVLFDICSFMEQLQQLDGVNAIFFAANYLNELTGRKWDHHLKMAQSTWELTNTLYDFDSGQARKSTLVTESTARELNDWMEQSYSWSNKTFNDRDAHIEHRAEREQDMNQLARASYSKAIIEESVRCPIPPSTSENYDNLYQKQVKPLEMHYDYAKEDVRHYSELLNSMGPKFMNNEGQLAEYVEGLQHCMAEGVTYTRTPRTGPPKSQWNVDPSKADAADKANEATLKQEEEGGTIPPSQKGPAPALKKSPVKNVYFQYTPRDNTAQWCKPFQDKWSTQWSTYVTAKWSSSGSLGAITGDDNTDARKQVESEFRDLAEECSEYRIQNQNNLNVDSGDYRNKMDKLISDCNQSLKVDEKTAGSLFDFYARKLTDAVKSKMNYKMQIWSLESKILGLHRDVPAKPTQSIPGTDGSFSVIREAPESCPEKMNLTAADLSLLNLKQQQNQAELELITAKNSIKQTQMMENEQAQKAKEGEETTRRNNFMEHKNAEAAKAITSTDSVPIKQSGRFFKSSKVAE
jgi:hypothetical protein